MNITLIESSTAFAALEGEWRDLLAASSAESPFLTWDWLNAWWINVGGSRRLAILTLRDGSELVGIVPLSISRERLPGLWRWEFLGTGFAGSDYLDMIARQDREQEVVSTIADFFASRSLALRLDHLPANSLLAKLETPLAADGWIVRQMKSGVCPFISLAGHSWDSFLATVGPAHRATTRRRLRTLQRDFGMRFEQVTDEVQRREVLEKLFTFHEARWDDTGTAFKTTALRRFHHDATSRSLARGWLRLYGLYLNDDLVAVMYGFSYRNRFYFYQHGFDPRYRQHGVGRAVLDLSIQAAIAEGLSEFDLLYGDEPYKLSWTQKMRPLSRFDFFPPHLGGLIHRRTVEAERTVRMLARRVISLGAHATHTS
jgi:CelD/BcsL family acetyltransferase involved in cellulose biosynthesis